MQQVVEIGTKAEESPKSGPTSRPSCVWADRCYGGINEDTVAMNVTLGFFFYYPFSLYHTLHFVSLRNVSSLHAQTLGTHPLNLQIPAGSHPPS